MPALVALSDGSYYVCVKNQIRKKENGELEVRLQSGQKEAAQLIAFNGKYICNNVIELKSRMYI